MSNVVIFIDDDNTSGTVLMKLQKATKRGLSEIREALASESPVIEQEIFDGNFDDHSLLIRNVLTVLEEGEIGHRIYELPEGKTMDMCEFVDRYLINIEVMRNILNQADEELDRQLNEQSQDNH